jgi:hypothetical protein
MMKYRMLVVALLIIPSAFAQVAPPMHVDANLSPAGGVQLNWESGPPEGLVEDFTDGIAQDFLFHTPISVEYPGGGYYSIENGHTEIVSGWSSNWGSSAYTAIEYENFTCEIEIANSSGQASRGMLFRGEGVFEDSYNGYLFVFALTPGAFSEYSIWLYYNGFPLPIINFTYSGSINTGPNDTNVLKVVGSGQDFDFYINDILIDSMTESSYSSGFVGVAQASVVIAEYNNITCSYNAQLMPRWIEREHGEVNTAWLDPSGHPTDTAPVMAKTEPFVETEDTRYLNPNETDNRKREILRFAQDDTDLDELDEFIEYRIYRDDVMIGSTEDTTFNDHLPAYGEYEYRVTAYYDPEGESIPSVAATANWQSVTYNLSAQNTVVPSTGGTVTYDAQLFSELAQTFPGASYRTFVTLPDQTVYGPTFQYNFTLAPFMNIMQTGLTQTIPANAPPGDYIFTGRLFYQGTPILEQSFDFDKMGP